MTKRKVVLTTDVLDPIFLHWGVAKDEPNQWLLPEEKLWPEQTTAVSPMARVRERIAPGRLTAAQSVVFASEPSGASPLEPKVVPSFWGLLGAPAAAASRYIRSHSVAAIHRLSRPRSKCSRAAWPRPTGARPTPTRTRRALSLRGLTPHNLSLSLSRFRDSLAIKPNTITDAVSLCCSTARRFASRSRRSRSSSRATTTTPAR